MLESIFYHVLMLDRSPVGKADGLLFFQLVRRLEAFPASYSLPETSDQKPKAGAVALEAAKGLLHRRRKREKSSPKQDRIDQIEQRDENLLLREEAREANGAYRSAAVAEKRNRLGFPPEPRKQEGENQDCAWGENGSSRPSGRLDQQKISPTRPGGTGPMKDNPAIIWLRLRELNPHAGFASRATILRST